MAPIMKQKAHICDIPWEKVRQPVLRFFLRCTHRLFENMLGLTKLNEAYSAIQAMPGNDRFVAKILRWFEVTPRYNQEDFDAIPETGPVMVVANHPFGGMEGIILIEMLKRRRPDVKAMANYILGMIPEIRDDFILVDPFGSKDAVRTNVKSMKESVLWLKEGHVLIVFPAGEVSSFDRKAMRIRDPQWSPSVAALLRKAGEATVVPCFFPGRNSVIFNVLGFVHPLLRTALLPRQMLRLRGSGVEVAVGTPLRQKDLEPFTTDDLHTMLYLRFRTYLLEERKQPKPRRHLRFLSFTGAAPPQEPIVAAEPGEVLAGELATLSKDYLMVENGDLEVWCAPASAIPRIIREIGRLRELTFRVVGEGTGKAIDLDEFDDYYNHLFMWNRVRQEIVGSYRLGLVDRVLDNRKVTALYTRTLFKFDERFLTDIGPSVELGRSFVRTEYQRAFNSLFLLWRGISTFIARHPHYTTLFGPVSITNEYRQASRCMMLACLRQTCWNQKLAELVSPRIPPKMPKFSEWTRPEYAYLLNDVDFVSDFVKEVERNQRDIPVLVRQYMRLGGELVAFNVDPDFSTVVDGLIIVKLTQTPAKILGRYMGREAVETYFAANGVDIAKEESA